LIDDASNIWHLLEDKRKPRVKKLLESNDDGGISFNTSVDLKSKIIIG